MPRAPRPYGRPERVVGYRGRRCRRGAGRQSERPAHASTQARSYVLPGGRMTGSAMGAPRSGTGTPPASPPPPPPPPSPGPEPQALAPAEGRQRRLALGGVEGREQQLPPPRAGSPMAASRSPPRRGGGGGGGVGVFSSGGFVWEYLSMGWGLTGGAGGEVT